MARRSPTVRILIATLGLLGVTLYNLLFNAALVHVEASRAALEKGSVCDNRMALPLPVTDGAVLGYLEGVLLPDAGAADQDLPCHLRHGALDLQPDRLAEAAAPDLLLERGHAQVPSGAVGDLDQAGLGFVSARFDGDAPHAPRGPIASA